MQFSPDRIIAFCRQQGVSCLLQFALNSSAALSFLPPAVAAGLLRIAKREKLIEHLRRRELMSLLENMAAYGLAPLLLKGAALAYSHYPQAYLRERGDTDLLLPRDQAVRARAVLADLGYHCGAYFEADYLGQQYMASKVDRQGVYHEIDIHWQLNNRLIFGRNFDYQELAAERANISGLIPQAYGLSPVHAFLLSCMHRVAENNSERLIWLYDHHLLLNALSGVELQRLRTLALERGIGAVAWHSIRMTQAAFETALAPGFSESFGKDVSNKKELSRKLLRSDRGDLYKRWLDFRSLPGWRAKWRMAREHLAPCKDYLVYRYGDGAEHSLSWYYRRRIGQGLQRIFSSRH